MNGRAGIHWEREGPLPPEILEELQFVAPRELNLHAQFPVRGAQLLRDFHHFGEDFILWEREQCILLPLSVSLRAEIVQDTAQVTVTQLFWNNSDYVIPKGFYTLPLPAGCTVTHFTCRVGSEKVVKAKVKPKEEARDAFQRAVRNDRTAGLVE